MNLTGTILIVTAILILVIAECIYISKRIATCFDLKQVKLIAALLIAGFLSFVLSSVAYRVFDLSFLYFYYIASTWWIGAFAIISMVIFSFEIINVIYKVFNKRGGLAILSLSLAISVFATLQAFDFKVVPVEIKIKGVKKQLRIVHLSDLHIGVYRGRRYLKRVVDTVNQLNADIVIINGDLVDSKNDVKMKVLLPLGEFKAPVHCVMGNHEYYAGLRNVLRMLNKLKIKVLINDSIVFKGVQFTGLDFMKPDKKSRNLHFAHSKTIKDVMPKIKLNAKLPRVLFHHSPWGEKYIQQAGVQLMVSGHTHGGQMFPITLLGELLYCVNSGLGRYKNMQIYVSQGVGTFGPPMRLGTHGEITLITLRGE